MRILKGAFIHRLEQEINLRRVNAVDEVKLERTSAGTAYVLLHKSIIKSGGVIR